MTKTPREKFEDAVFPFVAEIIRLGTGFEPLALHASHDDRSTVVVCENGNVYRVKTRVEITTVEAEHEGDVPDVEEETK